MNNNHVYVTVECRCGWFRNVTVESHERKAAVDALSRVGVVHEDTNIRKAYRHDTSVKVEGGR